MLLPLENASGSRTYPNSADDQMIRSSAKRERCDHAERGSRDELDQEVAVADRVHAVRATPRETRARAASSVAIERERRAGDRAAAERREVGAVRIGGSVPVALQHGDVDQERAAR